MRKFIIIALTLVVVPILFGEDTIRYCLTLTPSQSHGIHGVVWEGAMRLTPTELGPHAGQNIIAICWYHYDTDTYSENVKVYGNGTPTQPGPVLTTESYNTSTQGWVRVNLSNPVLIPVTGDLWCAVEIPEPSNHPIAIDDGPMVNGKGGWVCLDNYAWLQLTDLGRDNNWCIMAIVRGTGIEEETSVMPNALMFKALTITKGNAEIEFTLPEPAGTELVVYDATGRLCKSLLSTHFGAGTHNITTALDFPTGIYFYNLRTESGLNIARKFLFIR